jgi:hypothetical protein
VSEKRAPTHSSPPDVGAQKQGGRTRPTMFLEQPDSRADSRGTGKQGGRYTDRLCFARTEAASPSSVYRCTQRYGRVAALGSGCAAEPKASRRRGADCVVFQGFFSVVNYRSPLQSLALKPYKAKVGAIVGVRLAEPYRTCPTSSAIGRAPISSEVLFTHRLGK